jgi:hypothetical protein
MIRQLFPSRSPLTDFVQRVATMLGAHECAEVVATGGLAAVRDQRVVEGGGMGFRC